MEIQLIAMDLDGTALQPDHRTVSPLLMQTLEAAHDKGIHIVPVTGRAFKMLPQVLEADLPWKEYGILCNGSQIRNIVTEEILHNLPIDPADVLALLRFARERQFPAEISYNSKLYLTREDLQREQQKPELEFHYTSIIQRNGIFVEDLVEFYTGSHIPVEKINYNAIPSACCAGVEELLPSLNVSGVWTGSGEMELTHRNATKGAALTRLCRLLDIPLEATMALGDSGNDLSMLQTAGIGVAMGNAPAWVQQEADAVTAANTEDGAALAIQRYAL